MVPKTWATREYSVLSLTKPSYCAMCHRQIWGFSGGRLWCSTRTSSISAAGPCIWYVCSRVPWPSPRESGNSRRGRLRVVTQPPQIQRARWPRVAEVQSGGRSMMLILLLHKKQAGMVPFFLCKIVLVYKEKSVCVCTNLLNSDRCCGRCPWK